MVFPFQHKWQLVWKTHRPPGASPKLNSIRYAAKFGTGLSYYIFNLSRFPLIAYPVGWGYFADRELRYWLSRMAESIPIEEDVIFDGPNCSFGFLA